MTEYSQRTRGIGEHVILECGGYGGLNFEMLCEERGLEPEGVPIVDRTKDGYVVSLGSGYRLKITEWDINQESTLALRVNIAVRQPLLSKPTLSL